MSDLPKDIVNNTKFNPEGYKAMMNFVDFGSKWAFTYLVHAKSAEESIKCLEDVICDFTPIVIKYDNGKEMRNNQVQEWL